MKKLNMENMISGRESTYSLVMAVAKRARDITIEAEENEELLDEKPVLTAIKDFESNNYEIFEPENDEQ